MDPVKISAFFRKNRWMIILSVLSLILLLVFFNGNETGGKNTVESTNFQSYSATLQKELETTLSQMSGVGKCTVFITFSDEGETVYAYDEDLSTSEGKTDSDRKYVLISSRSDGLVLKVYSPSVLGIAVICEGGDSARVKSDVTEILSRTLGLTADRIAVKKMNP
ncbi:MAG: hypothetical protein J6B86_00250 [Clostridia bacterium]|nr:hypothetical protein [Clostridia bacterium]